MVVSNRWGFSHPWTLPTYSLLVGQLRDGIIQITGLNVANPLLNDLSVAIQQEDVGLVAIAQLLLEGRRPAVVDVEEAEGYPTLPFIFEPVHDGRQATADRSPKCEELDDLRLSGGQVHRLRIAGFERRIPERKLVCCNQLPIALILAGSSFNLGSARWLGFRRVFRGDRLWYRR